MAAESNVILRIGSKLGPGGFASLQAGIQMLGRVAAAIVGVGKDAEKFQQVYQRLTIDISEADRATGGLADTLGLMQSANKFTAAGMKLTADQFAAVAKMGTNMARTLGTDVDVEINKLTESISKGQSRALKQYGIDLEETEDLLLAQAEAIDKVTAAAADLADMQIETASEGWRVFKNDVGTAIGLMWTNSDSIVNAFQASHDALAELNTALDDGAASVDVFGGFVVDVGLNILDTVGIFGNWTDEIEANQTATYNLITAQQELLALNKTIKAQENEMTGLQNLTDAMRGGDAGLSAAAKELTLSLGAERAAELWPSLEKQIEQKRLRTTRLGAGGGGKKKRGRAGAPADPLDQYLRDDTLQGPTNATADDIALMGGAGVVGNPFAPTEEELQRAAQLREINASMISAQTELMRAQGDSVGANRLQFSAEQEAIDERRLLIAESTKRLQEELLYGGIGEAEFEHQLRMNESSMEYLEIQEQTLAIRRDQFEQEMTFAGQFSKTWNEAMGEVELSTMLATRMHQAFEGAVHASVRAMMMGGKSAWQAAKQVLVAVAAEIAAESFVRALYEEGRAIQAFASYQYAEGAAHQASAIKWGAVGAVAMAGGALMGRGMGSGGSVGTPNDVGLGGTPGAPRMDNAPPTGGSSGSSKTEIIVTLEGDVRKFMSTAMEENDNRKRHGMESF